MAVAGKVAITLSTENGGAWSADVTYDRLVAVKHNNNLYISRKTVANVEPPNNEFWFLALEGFSGDDVEDIIDGTTQVGNAKTLDGHGAEYFAPKTDLANYLPLNGGAVSGNLIVDANNPHPIALVNLTGNSVIPRYTGQSGTLGYLGFNGANNPVYGTSEGFFKTLLHTGNKPSGSYTGNGSATERRIETRGTGSVCMIWKNGASCISTSGGAFGMVVNEFRTSYHASFINGTIIMQTTDDMLNASGETYYYQVL